MTRDVIDEGQLVHEGDVVAEIALRPVIVLAGPIPVFRDLGPDSVGQDVRQLEQALERLGHFPATPDDRFDPVTSAALARLYDSLGYAAPGGPSSSAPASEIVVVPSLPRRAEVVTTMTGRPVEGPLLALATEAVDVILSAEDAGLLPEMVPVETYISDPSIVETISLSPVGGTASVNGIPSALRPDKPIPQRLVGRNVAVTMRFALTDGAVIAVPVSGVRSGLGDSTYVQVAREGRTRRVDVELGVAADGYVEVASSSSVLRVGDTVVVGS